MPLTQEIRQNVLAYEQRFKLYTGAIDLLDLYDSLREWPENLRYYIEACREMRAEKRTTSISA